MSLDLSHLPDNLTREQAAAYIGCSTETIDRMRQDGELPWFPVRTAVRIPRSGLDAVINGTSKIKPSRRAARQRRRAAE